MEQSRKSEHFKYICGNTWLPGKQGNVCLRSQVLSGGFFTTGLVAAERLLSKYILKVNGCLSDRRSQATIQCPINSQLTKLY